MHIKYKVRKDALLILEDGSVYKGKAIGAVGTATGEICFNTGMTGYQEIFTDPSYYGQILLTTTSHIGNYGTLSTEVESSSMKIAGLVCNEFSDSYYSRSGDAKNIHELFVESGMVGITDIDTRAIVRYVRDKGAMNAIISSDNLDEKSLKELLSNVPSMAGLELASKVSTTEAYEYGDPNAEIRVAVLDLGVKESILRCLDERGCYLKVFPLDASFEEMKSWNPDGFMLSNGPGDPSQLHTSIETVKELIQSDYPVFGICLGHQVLAIASGLATSKMHNGHRGINHPVKNEISGKCEVTSQNHGFVVNREDVEKHPDVEITHTHLNDNTVAGIRLKNKKIFSVQYHPEACAGPHDSRYLFDEFVVNITNNVSKEQVTN